MPISTASVSVGVAATQLSVADRGGTAEGQSVLVKNPAGGALVYLGGSDVTTAAGFPLEAGASASFDISGDDVLFAVVAVGTQTVNVLRTGV